MKKIINAITKFVTKNLWVTFLLNFKSIIDFSIWFFDKIKGIITMPKNNIMTTNFPLEYNDYMLLVVTVILYFILRAFLKMKKEADESNTYWLESINTISQQLTDNLNDSARILNTKIRYVDFRLENKSLDNDNYIKKLHNSGFSKEDLQEIGVDETFIKQNSNKLLPRTVIEKYKEFKYELNKHNQTKNEPPTTP